jgi:hypothetical protein
MSCAIAKMHGCPSLRIFVLGLNADVERTNKWVRVSERVSPLKDTCSCVAFLHMMHSIAHTYILPQQLTSLHRSMGCGCCKSKSASELEEPLLNERSDSVCSTSSTEVSEDHIKLALCIDTGHESEQDTEPEWPVDGFRAARHWPERSAKVVQVSCWLRVPFVEITRA